MDKWLYCEKCKKFPDEIETKYLEPVKENRRWNQEQVCYKILWSSIEFCRFGTFCSDCGTKLVFETKESLAFENRIENTQEKPNKISKITEVV